MNRLFRYSAFLVLSLFFLLACLSGCSSSSGPDNGSISIEVTPDSLDFDSTMTRRTFNINNTGSSEVTWNVGDNRDWITSDPTGGSITTETDQVNVDISRSGLDPGDYAGVITVTSGGGSIDIPITMRVPVSQTLAISHDKLLFRTHIADLSFKITNAGQGTLTWSISDDQDWIEVTPTSGNTTTEEDIIYVSVDRTGLESGDYVGTISITSDGGNIDLPIYMTVPQILENGTEYFPMAEGDTWYFTWPDSEKVIVRTVSGDTVINSATCARVLENDTTAEAWTKDGSGFHTHLLAGFFRFEPPLTIPFDLEEGLPYNYASNVFYPGQTEQFILSGSLEFTGYTSKTVPAGQFNDVIELFYNPDDPEDSDYYEYYARDVGLLDNGDYILDSAYIGGIWYKP